MIADDRRAPEGEAGSRIAAVTERSAEYQSHSALVPANPTALPEMLPMLR